MSGTLFGAAYRERPWPTDAPEGASYEPCARCGESVRVDVTHLRVEFDDQGWFAIGAACARRVGGAKKFAEWPWMSDEAAS